MSKRYRATSAHKLVEHLRAGPDPSAEAVPPSRSLHGGCTDPDHCPQHSGRTRDGEAMLSVRTKLSGRALHRLAVQLGLPTS